MLNQQPTPATYRPVPATSMAHADAIAAACDELKARFKNEPAFDGLRVDDTDEGVTIIVQRRGFTVAEIGWQTQCNDIERALLIGAPTLDLMIVVA